MKRFLLLIVSILFFSIVQAQISVDRSQKFLIETKTGKPFFWLGDTGWELFHRMTRDDAAYYLDKRKSQGFNIIQAVALAEFEGLRQPNRYGDVPFKNETDLEWEITTGSDPNNADEYDYWDNVDYVIKEAAKRNLYIGLLPTWGDKVTPNWGAGPTVFDDPQKAYVYAKKLAERYKDQWNIIWILGGDRPGFYERGGKYYDVRPIWRAMAKAIRDVYGSDVFITYHTGGSSESSSAWFHTEDWLKMNSIQSGHGSRTYPVWEYIRKDLQQKPQKPTMDMEPSYEDHPVNPWDDKWTRKERGYFSPSELRTRIYRGVFAGGCGTTYGHHSVWQFLNTELNPPIFTGDTIIHWRRALDAEVADQMHHLKNLMESRKDFNRVEDPSLIASDKGSDYRDLIIATRNEKGTYAFIHLPQPKKVSLNLDKLKKGKKKALWFNPAKGTYTKVKKKYSSGIQSFTPPNQTQQDWVLVIEAK